MTSATNTFMSRFHPFALARRLPIIITLFFVNYVHFVVLFYFLFRKPIILAGLFPLIFLTEYLSINKIYLSSYLQHPVKAGLSIIRICLSLASFSALALYSYSLVPVSDWFE